MYGMNVVHTGGNMMQDGFGVGVSDDIVITESVANGTTEDQVYERMKAYLGIDPYHVTIDPQGDYIAHVDCWGKFLAPDKIVLARVPKSNPRYEYYEEVADYFATTNCSWGYPYKIYRIDIPGNGIISPYTNSLILNKKVLVPMGAYSTFNEKALAVYREAMPGYEVIGIENKNAFNGWLNTDALHCRTRGVMDFDMLYIDHRDVLFGEYEWQDSMAVTSKVIAYSGAELKQDSILVYYSIDNADYQSVKMQPTENADEYVAYIKGYKKGSKVNYYVFAADESGRNRQQPMFGKLEPHSFTIEGEENIFENDIANVRMFPNPVNDILFVEMNEIVEEISVYSVAGVVVCQQTIDSGQQILSMDVASLKSGIYFIKLKTDEGDIVKHFIKK
jgi:hypothetical protein